MKLCFNSTTLRGFPVQEAMRLIHSHGYAGVELTLNDAHIHPLRYTRDEARALRGLCEDLGLEIAVLAAGGPALLGETDYEPSLISPDAAGRQRRLDVIRCTIALAHELGCPLVNINSGRRAPEVSEDQAWVYLLDGLLHLRGSLGDGVRMVLEQEPGFFVGTTEKAAEVIDALNCSEIRMCLDLGHVFCSQNNCYRAIEQALRVTEHIHIEDIKGGVHHHEIPGEGDMDFTRIGRLLKQAGYGGWVSVELHHHDQMWQRALDESRDYLQACWSNLS